MRVDRNIVAEEHERLAELLDSIEMDGSRDEVLSAIPGDLVRNEHDRSLAVVSSGGRVYYVKLWWHSGLVRYIKNRVRGGTGSAREARGLLLLKRHGFRTPPLVAYGTVSRSRLSGFGYIITEEVPDAVSVADWLFEQTDAGALDKLGETISRMHAEGISHGDLHPENVMLERDAPGEFLFLDCMQVQRGRSRWPIVADLVNFMFYADRFAWPLKEGVLERMLRSYHGRGTAHFTDLDGLKRTIARGVRRRTASRAVTKRLRAMVAGRDS